MTNLQQYLQLPDDVATRMEIVDREVERYQRLVVEHRAMRELLRKIGQAAGKFESRPDNTTLILMDYGAQCGLYQELTIGVLREAEKWGGDRD